MAEQDTKELVLKQILPQKSVIRTTAQTTPTHLPIGLTLKKILNMACCTKKVK